MPASDLLVLLIVRDAGLRSSLIARLSLLGVELVTTSRIQDPWLERSIRRPAVLVLDEEAISDRPPEWLDAQLGDCRWRFVVLLSDQFAAGANSRLMRISRSTAPSALAELLLRTADIRELRCLQT